MPVSEEILPPHSGRAERALVAGVLDSFQIEVLVRHIYSPDTSPAQILPWLAWTLSVDDWDDAWTEAEKRLAIAGSAAWHRIKGTRPSMIAALAQLGHADAILIEDRDMPRYGRGVVYGRAWVYGPEDPSWADYWVVVRAPLTRADADRITARLRETAPARCRLRSIRADAGHRFAYGDGLWTYGTAVSFGSIYHYGETDG